MDGARRLRSLRRFASAHPRLVVLAELLLFLIFFGLCLGPCAARSTRPAMTSATRIPFLLRVSRASRWLRTTSSSSSVGCGSSPTGTSALVCGRAQLRDRLDAREIRSRRCLDAGRARRRDAARGCERCGARRRSDADRSGAVSGRGRARVRHLARVGAAASTPRSSPSPSSGSSSRSCSIHACSTRSRRGSCGGSAIASFLRCARRRCDAARVLRRHVGDRRPRPVAAAALGRGTSGPLDVVFLGGVSAVGAIVAVLAFFAPSGLGAREGSMYGLMLAIVSSGARARRRSSTASRSRSWRCCCSSSAESSYAAAATKMRSSLPTFAASS